MLQIHSQSISPSSSDLKDQAMGDDTVNKLNSNIIHPELIKDEDLIDDEVQKVFVELVDHEQSGMINRLERLRDKLVKEVCQPEHNVAQWMMG
ncbi:UNVERIFIED_CONTAM: hypothetical protein K2H54_055354 [Gekko kuhli]